MAKTSSKKHISAKYDVVIKTKATTTRIVDINNEIVTAVALCGARPRQLSPTLLEEAQPALALALCH
jgi:hypothetical protein